MDDKLNPQKNPYTYIKLDINKFNQPIYKNTCFKYYQT